MIGKDEWKKLMGIDVHLCTMYEREDATFALRSLSQFLCSENKIILAQLEYQPEFEQMRLMPNLNRTALDARGIKGFPLEPLHGYPHYYSYTISLGVDFSLQAFAGKHYFLLTMMAFVSMILLEERYQREERSILKKWLEFAKKSNALFGWMEMGDDKGYLMYPVEPPSTANGDRSIDLDNNLFGFEDYNAAISYSIDEFAEHTLFLNKHLRCLEFDESGLSRRRGFSSRTSPVMAAWEGFQRRISSQRQPNRTTLQGRLDIEWENAFRILIGLFEQAYLDYQNFAVSADYDWFMRNIGGNSDLSAAGYSFYNADRVCLRTALELLPFVNQYDKENFWEHFSIVSDVSGLDSEDTSARRIEDYLPWLSIAENAQKEVFIIACDRGETYGIPFGSIYKCQNSHPWSDGIISPKINWVAGSFIEWLNTL